MKGFVQPGESMLRARKKFRIESQKNNSVHKKDIVYLIERKTPLLFSCPLERHSQAKPKEDRSWGNHDFRVYWVLKIDFENI